MKIAREGYPWIIGASLCALFFIGAGLLWPAWVCLFFVLAFGFFFRDPERTGPTGEGVILAPADGKVVAITGRTGHDGRVQAGRARISIFLSLLDVHVNRAPIAGKVGAIRYQRGKFLAAFREEASQANEHNAVRLTSRTGKDVEVVQIAGLLARRIICCVREGQELTAGQRLGIIMFGSRVDLFLPEGSRVAVTEGQKVHAGLTVLGRLP